MEFDVLGFKIKLKPDEGDGDAIQPKEVVDYVHREAVKIQELAPQLEKGQVAILVALNLAKDRMAMEREYSQNVAKLQNQAVDALKYIEEVSPTTK